MYHQHTLMLKPIFEALGITQPAWLGVAAIAIIFLMLTYGHKKDSSEV